MLTTKDFAAWLYVTLKYIDNLTYLTGAFEYKKVTVRAATTIESMAWSIITILFLIVHLNT